MAYDGTEDLASPLNWQLGERCGEHWIIFVPNLKVVLCDFLFVVCCACLLVQLLFCFSIAYLDEPFPAWGSSGST